jgi:hypothetical protein
VKAKLEDILVPWENVDFSKILQAERERLGLSVSVFMKALRYALTGMKVGLFPFLRSFLFLIYVVYQDGPSIAAIMKVIGRETTLERLVLPQSSSVRFSTIFREPRTGP